MDTFAVFNQCPSLLLAGHLGRLGHLSFFNSKEGSIEEVSTGGVAVGKNREIEPDASPVLPPSGDGSPHNTF